MDARAITISDKANEKGEIIPGLQMDGRWRSTSGLEWPEFTHPPKSY